MCWLQASGMVLFYMLRLRLRLRLREGLFHIQRFALQSMTAILPRSFWYCYSSGFRLQAAPCTWRWTLYCYLSNQKPLPNLVTQGLFESLSNWGTPGNRRVNLAVPLIQPWRDPPPGSCQSLRAQQGEIPHASWWHLIQYKKYELEKKE
jgi:hypothetical protein